MKKINIFLFFAVSAIVSLTSCELRSDVYMPGVPESHIMVALKNSPQTPTYDRNIILPNGKRVEMYIVCDVDTLSEYRVITYSEVLLEGDAGALYVGYNERDNSYYVVNRLSPDYIAESESVLRLTFKCVDFFGRQSTVSVTVSTANAVASNFSIETVDNGNRDYTISVELQKTPGFDHEEQIVAYEYNIDGDLWHDGWGYEGEYDYAINPNPGHAAQKGTYIISSPLSQIRHRFQSAGTHSVSVRVKNDSGLWSLWKTVDVDVD